MAALNSFYTQQLIRCEHIGDTDWSRGDTDLLPRIAGSSLVANNKYLVIAGSRLSLNNPNTVARFRVNIKDDTALRDKSEMAQELPTSVITRGAPYFFVHSFTTAATPLDIDMEFLTDGQSRIVAGDQCALALLDLTQLGASNYFETIHADPGAGTDAYPTTQADEWAIPGSDLGTNEFLILAYQRTQIDLLTNLFTVEAFAAADTPSSAIRARDINEGEDLAELRMTGFVLRHQASSGTPDFAIQTKSGGTDDHFDRGGYGIALAADAFADFVFAYESGATAVDSTERTFATIPSYSPTADADHLFFAGMNQADTETSAAGIRFHVEDDGAELRVGDEPLLHTQLYDELGNAGATLFHMTPVLASDTSDYTLRASRSGGSDDTLANRWLLILSLELATGAVQRTFTGVIALADLTGATTKEATKLHEGTIATAAGDLIRKTSKLLEGTLTSSGFSNHIIPLFQILVTGAIATAGAIALKTATLLEGIVSSSAELRRRTATLFEGTIASGDLTGALTNIKKILITLAGAITTLTGETIRKTLHTPSGDLTSAGTLIRATTQLLEGTLTMSGFSNHILPLFKIAIGGALTLAGGLIRQTQTTKTASTTPAGQYGPSVVRKLLEGTSTQTGDLSLTRTIVVALSGALTLAGGLIRRTAATMAATAGSSGALTRATAATMSGDITPSGDLRRKTSVLFAAALTLAGSLANALIPPSLARPISRIIRHQGRAGAVVRHQGSTGKQI